MIGPIETTKRVRPKAPRATHFIQIEKFGVFVVEAETFAADGGDFNTARCGWIPVIAESTDQARMVGEAMLVRIRNFGAKK